MGAAARIYSTFRVVIGYHRDNSRGRTMNSGQALYRLSDAFPLSKGKLMGDHPLYENPNVPIDHDFKTRPVGFPSPSSPTSHWRYYRETCLRLLQENPRSLMLAGMLQHAEAALAFRETVPLESRFWRPEHQTPCAG